jgi:hypothetical protein
MKKIIIFCILFFFKSNLFSQNKTMDVYNKLEVITFISKKIESSDYLVYNIDKRYMVVNKQTNIFKIFFIEQRLNVKSQLNEYYLIKTKVIKKSDVFDRLFINDSSNFESINESEAGEKYLFFSLTLKSYTVCQFFLPTFYYNTGQKDIKLPIDKDLHKYLNTLFFKCRW